MRISFIENKNLKISLSKYKKLYDEKLRNAFKWSFIGQILSRIINLISAILLARLMTPDGYGKYIYIIGTLIFFAQLAGLSIRTISTRNIAYLLGIDKNRCNKYIFITLILGLSLAFLVFMLLLCLLFIFQESIIVKEYSLSLLSIVLIALFSELIYLTTLGILEGVKSFKNINITTIQINALKLIFSYIGFITFSIEGAIIGWVIASIVGTLICYTHLHHIFKSLNIKISSFRIKEYMQELKLFFDLSIPSSLEAGIILFSTWFIQTIILNNQESGKSEIAIFNIANQWKALSIYLPAIVINMLQSFLSEYQGTGNKNNIKVLYGETKKIIILVSGLLIGFFLLFSKVLISLFGNGYETAYFVLIILIIPTVMTNINALNRQLLISQGRIWLITINNFLTAIVTVVLFFVFKDVFTLSVSFAWAIGIGEFITFLMYYLMMKKNEIAQIS